MRLALTLAVCAIVFTFGCGSSSDDQTSNSSSSPPVVSQTHHPLGQIRTARRPIIERTSAPVVSTSEPQSGPQFFDDESVAQAHCPNDTVVWLNTNSGIYHMPGERWYGATESGSYMCQQEADAAGYRETRNGQ